MISPETYPDPQKVVVIGANGQTGFRVITLLQKSPRYHPIAMIREEAQASRFEELGVPYFISDLDTSTSPTTQELEGAHTVIFAAGAGR
jgi:N-acetyl-gamma-glutamylphosphate reductase